MKRITILLILTFLTGNIFAQDIHQKNVPAVVLNSFQINAPAQSSVGCRNLPFAKVFNRPGVFIEERA